MIGYDDIICDLERAFIYILLSILWVFFGKIIDRGWKSIGESYYLNYEF